jgi:hydrogenase maturation factor HypF (carbamoyltransferase family)
LLSYTQIEAVILDIMTTKDIRLSPDPDMAGSNAAMQRAGRSAEDLAIRTNTSIITMIDGKVVRLTADEIIKRREAESNKVNTELE